MHARVHACSHTHIYTHNIKCKQNIFLSSPSLYKCLHPVLVLDDIIIMTFKTIILRNQGRYNRDPEDFDDGNFYLFCKYL